MDKLSGLILDIYDDPDGGVLRSVFGGYDGVPELIKSAHALTASERGQLPDSLYALVLHDGDVTLRKYACVDAGNTALSVEYFLKTAHKLPVEAQKVAAENLATACGWYGITPPESLQKMAGLLGWAAKNPLNAVMMPGQLKGINATAKAHKIEAKANGPFVSSSVLTAKPTPGM